MSFKHIWIVFKKEVKDIVRDKKTLLTSLLVPIILMPLLFTLLGSGIENMEKDITENITIALSEGSDTEEIRDLVKNDIFLNNPDIKLGSAVKDPVGAIRNGDVRFVLEVDKNYAKNLEEGIPYSITVIYDQTDTKSSGSYEILVNAITQYNQKVVRERLEALDIDIQVLEPVKIIQNNAAAENAGGNLMLMMILPMLIS